MTGLFSAKKKTVGLATHSPAPDLIPVGSPKKSTSFTALFGASKSPQEAAQRTEADQWAKKYPEKRVFDNRFSTFW
jgi:hypothetical protein